MKGTAILLSGSFELLHQKPVMDSFPEDIEAKKAVIKQIASE
jgi:hypothetical protein